MCKPRAENSRKMCYNIIATRNDKDGDALETQCNFGADPLEGQRRAQAHGAQGSAQVGKTWLMKEFGQNYYDNFVYFNFDEEDELKSIFETNKNPHRIIDLLSMICGEKIEQEKTLIIFDEIQE